LKTAVVGGFTLDTNEYRGVVKEGVGGPPHYISGVFIGSGVELLIFSTVGRDFPRDYLERLCSHREITCLINRVDHPNIRFRNIYLDGYTRIQYAESPGYIVELERASSLLRDTNYIIVSPVLNEVPLDILPYLKNLGRLAVDPQGFLRSRGEDNRVRMDRLDISVFGDPHILKASIDELPFIDGGMDILMGNRDTGIEMFIVTLGEAGSIIHVEGDPYHIPAYPVGEEFDPTGAGDVFLGSLVIGLLTGYHGIDAAVYATAYTSIFLSSIESTRDEINRRMEFIWRRVRKLDSGEAVKLVRSP
jgi:sugar/nucleoside kinase (ribokinase family)